MDKPIRVGLLGLSHDHVWDNLPDLDQSDQGRLIAAAEPQKELREKFSQQFAGNTYTRYEDLLHQEQLDAVYIYADNAQGARLAQMAANQGLHVLIEKPMAADLEGAEWMLAAARQNGTRLMVNWPFAWWPQLRRALELAGAGEIGRLWQVKYRAAHAGPKELGCSSFFCDWLFDDQRSGGGAMMDYCCYGALLARTLLGMPSRVTATAGRLVKENITVEDNAVLVLTYPGAMAISEGSWSEIGGLSNYRTLIYGTLGTLMVEPREGGRLLMADHDHPQGTVVDVPAAEPAQRNATAHFLHCLTSGADFHALCTDRICRDTQEILEAGVIAIQHGQDVSLPLRT